MSGILSLKGFIYQKYVFVYYILNNNTPNTIFYYEKLDDISFEKSNHSKIEYNSNIIQCKMGDVDGQTFRKVIKNWLICDSTISKTKYTLFCKKVRAFKKDIIIKKMIEECLEYNSIHKNSASLEYKLYKKYYHGDIDMFKKIITNDFNEIFDKYESIELSMEDLEKELFELFKKEYCMDILTSDIPKKERYEFFIKSISSIIDDKIKTNNHFEMLSGEVNNIILECSKMINDDEYHVNYFDFHTKNKENAKKIYELKTREVEQLKFVIIKEQQIIEKLICKLMYDHYREFLFPSKKSMIKNAEFIGFKNYERIKSELEQTNKLTSFNLYYQTIEKKGNLIQCCSNSDILSEGGYIYLTSDDCDTEYQIEWEVKNESK